MSVSNKVDQFIKDSDIAHTIVHGPATETVETEGGPVPTFARAVQGLTDLPERVQLLESLQGAERVGYATWAEAVAAVARPLGAMVEIPVETDPGSHVDPVKPGNQIVPNGGLYIQREAGLEWMRPDTLAAKANRSDLVPIKQQLPTKAEREPLVESLYLVESPMVPLVGITSKAGEVQIPLHYDPASGDLINRGRTVLTDIGAGEHLADLHQAEVGDIVPMLGVADSQGVAQIAVGYNPALGALIVDGRPLGGGEYPLTYADATATIEGTNVIVRGALRTASGSIPISGVLAMAPPAPVPVNNVAYTLKANGEQRWYVNDNAPLPYRFITDVSCRHNEAPLAEGADFHVWYTGGKLRGVVGSGTREISLTYKGLPQRYDLIVADAITGALSIVRGTARNIDPQEYLPAVPAGKIALFSVFCYGQTVRLYGKARWQGITKRDRDMTALREYNRKALAPIRAALAQRRDITLVGYGDSITAMGGFAPHTAPNTAARDLKSFFVQMPADTYAAIPALDFGDGGGAIHSDLGWNRQLKAFIERTYGVQVEYLNYGIGGTTSGTGENAGRPNGLNPVRLQYVMDSVAQSSKPVLVNLAFGMNELGNAATVTNMTELVRTFQSLGATVQILGVPRPSSYGGFGSLPAWRYTNDTLYAVALATGAAFSPTAPYFDEEQLGYMGIAPESFAAAGNINHAGPAEFRFLAQPVIANFEI